MRQTIQTAYLTLTGLLLLAIGGAILIAPRAFYASNDIALGHDPTLLSEIRAPGGLLWATAILALISVARQHMRSFTTPLLVLVYGSFGLARLVSITQDGIPAQPIISAMILELSVAVIGVAILRQQQIEADSKIVSPAVSG